MGGHPTERAGKTEEADGWWRRNGLVLKSALRVLFGVIWTIDGIMKFTLMAPSDATNLVTGAGQGQPDWLVPWFNFWSGVVSANPSFWLYGIGVVELAVGLFLIFGLLRKTVYFGGILLSLMIWAADEGFGGPYGSGSSDIGAAVIYAVVFFALIVLDLNSEPDRFTLDARIERRFTWWRKVASLER